MIGRRSQWQTGVLCCSVLEPFIRRLCCDNQSRLTLTKKTFLKNAIFDALTGQLLHNLSAGLLSGGVHIESVSGYVVQIVQQLDRYSVDMADCNMA